MSCLVVQTSTRLLLTHAFNNNYYKSSHLDISPHDMAFFPVHKLLWKHVVHGLFGVHYC